VNKDLVVHGSGQFQVVPDRLTDGDPQLGYTRRSDIIMNGDAVVAVPVDGRLDGGARWLLVR
jgi:hypothetical protein